MNQTKYSLQDFKQELLPIRENSHFPIHGKLFQKGTGMTNELLIPKVKKSSFIVDWQLQDAYHQNIDNTHT